LEPPPCLESLRLNFIYGDGMRNSGVRHIARKAPAFRGHRFGGHHRDAFSGGAPTASGPVAAPPSRIRGGDGDGRGAPDREPPPAHTGRWRGGTAPAPR